jgi:hydrogenase maturation protease
MFSGMDFPGASASKLVIGVGNEFRGDDAAGLLVVRRITEQQLSDIEVVESSGHSAALIELWRGAELVVVVDAVSSGEKPGKVYRFEPIKEPIPQKLFSNRSTHDFGLVEAVELSRALDSLPKKLIVYGIVGTAFEPGDGISEEVALAIEAIIPTIIEDIS